jgi:ribonuclease P protein component
MKTFGFPRSRRLARQFEFKLLYRTGRKHSNRYLTVYASPVRGRRGKVGIVAGKRVGKAVERNRVRRTLRETFRTNQNRVDASTDLVIVAKHPALELSRRELAEQLLHVLGKSDVLDA